MKYNKLVRDKIPEIIKQKGGRAITHIADDDEYREKLLEKLAEEIAEFSKEPSEEELADIFEVLETIMNDYGFDDISIDKIKKKKAKERGSFKNRIILEES